MLCYQYTIKDIISALLQVILQHVWTDFQAKYASTAIAHDRYLFLGTNLFNNFVSFPVVEIRGREGFKGEVGGGGDKPNRNVSQAK
jgi:hypothetical protein